MSIDDKRNFAKKSISSWPNLLYSYININDEHEECDPELEHDTSQYSNIARVLVASRSFFHSSFTPLFVETLTISTNNEKLFPLVSLISGFTFTSRGALHEQIYGKRQNGDDDNNDATSLFPSPVFDKMIRKSQITPTLQFARCLSFESYCSRDVYRQYKNRNEFMKIPYIDRFFIPALIMYHQNGKTKSNNTNHYFCKSIQHLQLHCPCPETLSIILENAEKFTALRFLSLSACSEQITYQIGDEARYGLPNITNWNNLKNFPALEHFTFDLNDVESCTAPGLMMIVAPNELENQITLALKDLLLNKSGKHLVSLNLQSVALTSIANLAALDNISSSSSSSSAIETLENLTLHTSMSQAAFNKFVKIQFPSLSRLSIADSLPDSPETLPAFFNECLFECNALINLDFESCPPTMLTDDILSGIIARGKLAALRKLTISSCSRINGSFLRNSCYEKNAEDEIDDGNEELKLDQLLPNLTDLAISNCVSFGAYNIGDGLTLLPVMKKLKRIEFANSVSFAGLLGRFPYTNPSSEHRPIFPSSLTDLRLSGLTDVYMDSFSGLLEQFKTSGCNLEVLHMNDQKYFESIAFYDRFEFGREPQNTKNICSSSGPSMRSLTANQCFFFWEDMENRHYRDVLNRFENLEELILSAASGPCLVLGSQLRTLTGLTRLRKLIIQGAQIELEHLKFMVENCWGKTLELLFLGDLEVQVTDEDTDRCVPSKISAEPSLRFAVEMESKFCQLKVVVGGVGCGKKSNWKRLQEIIDGPPKQQLNESIETVEKPKKKSDCVLA